MAVGIVSFHYINLRPSWNTLVVGMADIWLHGRFSDVVTLEHICSSRRKYRYRIPRASTFVAMEGPAPMEGICNLRSKYCITRALSPVAMERPMPLEHISIWDSRSWVTGMFRISTLNVVEINDEYESRPHCGDISH